MHSLHVKMKLCIWQLIWSLKLHDFSSYTNSNNVVLVKTFCGRLVKFIHAACVSINSFQHYIPNICTVCVCEGERQDGNITRREKRSDVQSFLCVCAIMCDVLRAEKPHKQVLTAVETLCAVVHRPQCHQCKVQTTPRSQQAVGSI